MASGSIDYWVTIDNWMYSLLTIVKDAVKENGLIQTAIDSMDGKLDGVVNLETLTEAQTVYLAKMFLTDTVDGNGKNLLTKLDSLDGAPDGKLDLTALNAETAIGTARMYAIKQSVETGGDLITKLDNLDGVADGKLDLNKMKTFDIFYDSVAAKSRLEVSIDKLILAVAELVGVHADTTDMVAYGEEDWDGDCVGNVWTLISDENQKRNMIRVYNDYTSAVQYSRDMGVTVGGWIGALSSALFHDPDGVWLKSSTASPWHAHEEWAT